MSGAGCKERGAEGRDKGGGAGRRVLGATDREKGVWCWGQVEGGCAVCWLLSVQGYRVTS